jgi:uracil-DNA glycosylase
MRADVRAVIVGEAWGRREEQFQHALVGPTGRELSLEMGIAGFAPYLTMRCRKCKQLTEFRDARCKNCDEFIWPNEFNLIDYWKQLRERHGIHVTNVFNARPPSNNLGHFFGWEKVTPMPGWKANRTEGGSHVRQEYFHHITRLWKELDELKPNLVMALGNAACWALLGQTKITALRGTVNQTNEELTGLNLKVLPSFHPANVLRPTGRAMRPTVIADWTKAKREVEFREIRRPERYITIPAPNSSGLCEISEWLRRPAWRYANDIETIRGQISIVGFARERSDALVVPFRDCHSKDGRIIDVGKIAASIGFPNGGINFWPDASLEVEAWKLVIQGEESKAEKIGQNYLFDLSYLLRMGIRPKKVRHDTMLWHHSKYPEQPKSLGYLGSLYDNDIAWKQMSRQDSLKRDE